MGWPRFHAPAQIIGTRTVAWGWWVAVVVVVGGGCAGPQRNAVPEHLLGQAAPVGLAGVRDWGSEYSETLQASLVESIRQARAIDPRGVVDDEGYVNVLALSGGGSYGAYGAGLLCGWTEAGTRPPFKLVTGISTGALIAPFAFLGSAYDDVLRETYTQISTKDIYRNRPPFALLFDSSSLVDTTPLAELIAKYFDAETLAAVAAEHRRGRRLFVGTTHLDAGRLVIWDMGAIAASGHPNALPLFRQVLRASAAIPVAFPPVHIEVEAAGARYEEMHVDGGAATQVFFYGFTLDLPAAVRAAGVTALTPVRLYVIRNGTTRAPWHLVEPRLLPLVNRTVGGLLNAQGIGDLYRIYTIAENDGIAFNLAFIPDDFDFTGKESFDREEMNRLFELAFEQARGGYPWRETPPGFERHDHSLRTAERASR